LIVSVHRVPGFVKLNRDVAVTRVTVHGTTAKAHAKSSSKASVLAVLLLGALQTGCGGSPATEEQPTASW